LGVGYYPHRGFDQSKVFEYVVRIEAQNSKQLKYVLDEFLATPPVIIPRHLQQPKEEAQLVDHHP
jgi:hypothetical protein